MLGLNKIMLIGTVGRNPETRYIAHGVSFSKFSVAASISVPGPGGRLVEETEWLEVVVFRNLSEFAAQYLKRGDTVYVEGRLKSRYVNDTPESGHRIYDVLADKLIILTRCRANAGSPLPSAENISQDSGAANGQPRIGAGLPGFDIENIPGQMDGDGDSLPF